MIAPLFRFTLVLPFVLAGAFGCAGSARAQGTVRTTEEPAVVQPAPFSTTGKTVVVPRTRIEIDEGDKRLKGDALRRKRALPDAEGDLLSPTEAGPAEAGSCRGSKILCGDPLKRKKKKGEVD